MTTATRNITVGIFVLASLVVLGWMILWFGGQQQALRRTYTVKIWFESAGPVTTGSDVRVSGVVVGQVSKVKPQQDFTRGVVVYCEIQWDYRIPADAQPVIKPAVMGLGKPAIDMRVPSTLGPMDGDGPAADREFIARDDKAQMYGKLLTGFEGLIPTDAEDKLGKLAASLDQIVDSLTELLEPRPVAMVDAPATGPDASDGDRPMANISTVVQRLDEALKNANRLMGAASDEDVKVILANLRTASESVKAFSAGMNDFVARAETVTDQAGTTLRAAESTMKTADAQLQRVGDAVVDNSRQLAAALDQLTRAMEKVNAGKGTAGRMINDPKLYEQLLLSADRLNQTIAELQQLIRQWQEEGVGIKLK